MRRRWRPETGPGTLTARHVTAVWCSPGVSAACADMGHPPVERGGILKEETGGWWWGGGRGVSVGTRTPPPPDPQTYAPSGAAVLALHPGVGGG